MEIEDWIPVLEPVEENDALERHANLSLPEYIEKRQNGELNDIEDPWEEGSNSSVFYHTGGNASITADWGPRQVVEDGLMAEGFLSYSGNFQGDTVAEAEERIARQHSAPYLDIRQADHDNVEIEFSLPVDYNQERWKETVDTLVDVIDEFDQYQDDLETVSERYPK